MTEPLVRLAWALPLVLLAGWVAVLLLRRLLLTAGSAPLRAQRLCLCESLSLSERASVHLLEVDGRSYLLVESSQATSLQAVMPAGANRDARSGAAWLQRWPKAREP